MRRLMFPRLFGPLRRTFFAGAIVLIAVLALWRPFAAKGEESRKADPILLNAEKKITQGRQIFRFDTFGDEAFWGGQLQLHKAVEGAGLGDRKSTRLNSSHI